MPEQKPLYLSSGGLPTEFGSSDTVPQSAVPSGIPLSKLAQSGATIGQVVKWDGSAWAPANESGGGGEANTASNVGTGGGQFFKEKIGVDLRFRRLAVSGGLTVNTATDDVELSTTAPQPPTTETLHTSNFTAVKFRLHQVNTTSAAITVTPPSSPAIGDRFAVVDARLTAANNNIIINFGSQLIYGQSDTYVINVNGGYAEFIYMGTSTGWVATKG